MAKNQNQNLFVSTDALSTEVKELINDKSSFVSGNGTAIGTEYQIVEKLDVHEFINRETKETTKYIGWLCAGSTKDRPKVVTPRRMAEGSAFLDDEEFLATVKWAEGKSIENAFTISENSLGDANKELSEINDYLAKKQGKVTLIGKAKHPRFKGTYVQFYE